MRVLHCPSSVGGNGPGLAEAERKVGLDSWSVARGAHRYGYPVDEIVANSRIGEAFEKAFPLRLFLKTKHADLVHFNFGSTIFPEPYFNPASDNVIWRLYNIYANFLALKDLPVLKRNGKKIAVTFQGSDARQADYCRHHHSVSHLKEIESEDLVSDDYKRRKIQIFDRHADLIFALNPDLMPLLPDRAEFVPYASVDIEKYKPVDTGHMRPLVVHAPSSQPVKGTRYILTAVEKLKSEGVNFDFRLVENVSNQEAYEIYKQADILIDQLLVGWYGALAVEAMALAKPVICYIRDDDLKYIPPQMAQELPVIRANPDNIYSVLKSSLLGDKAKLGDIGQRGRRYVENWHDPIKIARFMKARYESV